MIMSDKGIFIKDIKENNHIDGLFLVKTKNNGITKNGKPYLSVTLTDKSGDVTARVWDNADKLTAMFDQGDIVAAKAYSVLYQGSLQLNISFIQRHMCENERLRDFLPASSHDPEECFKQLMDFVQSVGNMHLKKLLETIFKDDAVLCAFKTAPAAKSIHHDYLGGLLEHTLNITRLANDMAKHYVNINRDLLIAGAILHDIGKIRELCFERNFEYTDAGRLSGHIILGIELINDKLKLLPDFPQDLALVLKHLIVSHHGQYEFGSPKRPKTLEALMLSYLDDIDAKMYGFASCIKKERSSDSKWTGFNRLFDRYLYTDTFIEDATDPSADSENNE